MNNLTSQQLQRIAGYLGIAQRAGKIISGNNMVKEALLKKKVELVVIADDAAEIVKTEIISIAHRRRVDILFWPNKVNLGLIVGKSQRGSLVLLDAGFATAIKKLLNN